MNQPRFIVHVGFPKCGSTTLQMSLAKDFVQLEKIGIRQFGIGNGYEKKLLEYVNERNKSSYEKLGTLIKREIAESWEDAVGACAKSLIMSFEPSIFNFEKFIKLIPGEVDIEVVVVIRNLDSWVQSEFLQQLKSLHRKPQTSFDDFVEGCIEIGHCDHKKFIQMIEKHPKVRKVHVLPLVSENGLSISKRFYSEVLEIEKSPKRIENQNLSLSLDQAVILRTVIKLINSNFVYRSGEKSIYLRLGELVRGQQCGPPVKVYFQSQNRERIQKKSKEYTKWISSEYAIDLIDIDLDKINSINFDSHDRVSSYGLRFLMHTFIQLWIEILNANEREYEVNFEAEIKLLEKNRETISSRKWVALKDDFRIFDELLELLSCCVAAEGFDGQKIAKSPSRRMQEILKDRVGPSNSYQSATSASPGVFLEGISVQSLRYFLVAGAQVAWELYNEYERDWVALLNHREYSLASNTAVSLAN